MHFLHQDKVSADSCGGLSPWLLLSVATFSRGPHGVPSLVHILSVSVCIQDFHSYKDTHQIGRRPFLMDST